MRSSGDSGSSDLAASNPSGRSAEKPDARDCLDVPTHQSPIGCHQCPGLRHFLASPIDSSGFGHRGDAGLTLAEVELPV
jgi:hypothetical protein